jgi:hypothetical protein
MTSSLCPLKKYNEILGIPKKGVHTYRFLNTAAYDYFGTILIAIIISFVSGFPLELMTAILFVLGIVLHILFGVPTHTNEFLNIKC